CRSPFRASSFPDLDSGSRPVKPTQLVRISILRGDAAPLFPMVPTMATGPRFGRASGGGSWNVRGSVYAEIPRRSTRRQGRGGPLALALAITATSSTALSQTRDPAAAEALFRQGRQAMEAKDFATACPKFAESQRLDPAVGTLMNWATCEE